MSWGADVLGVTEDTFQMIKAATTGITTTTGIAGIDLLDDLVSWVPVDTPFFNSVPRGQGKGATRAFYQAIMNLNATQPTGGVANGKAAPVVKIKGQYVYSPYAAVGAGGYVNLTALAQGEGYATVLAVDTLQTINQQLIGLEIHQLLAISFPLPTVGTPTLAPSTGGGSIPKTTHVYVKCAPLSGVNWYRGGSQAAGAAGTTETGSSTTTNSAVASVAAVKCAAGYAWFVGSAATVLHYYTTTPVNTVTITEIPAEAQTIPETYAGLYHAGQTGPSTVPNTNTTHQTYWQNGLLGSILGNFASSPDQALTSTTVANLVTPGTGTTQGSFYKSLDGGQLVKSGAAITQIDEMNKRIYDKWNVTPSRMLMGSQVITDISNAVLGTPQAVTWLTPDGSNGRARAQAGGHVATYLNKTVNGRPIEMHLMPYLPPGKIISIIDSLPFPGANVSSALQVRTLYDFFRFDYGANREIGTATGGPRYDFEVRSRQAFINRASPVMGVLDNIGAGVG